MHSRKSINPILIGILLSLLLHGIFFYKKGTHTSAKPLQKQGKTTIHLTLAPSIAQTSPPTPPLQKPQKKLKRETPIAPTLPPKQPAPIISDTPPKPASIQPKTTTPLTPPPKLLQKKFKGQEGSLLAQKGVQTEASVLKSIQPTYPRISQRRGEEGTVTLFIEITSAGKPQHIKITQSSGHKRLDQSALKAIQQTRFIPATQLEKKIASTLSLSYTFQLTEE